MNKALNKHFFKWLLVITLVTSPVLAIADTISETFVQNQTSDMEMPCQQSKHDLGDSDQSGMHSTSDPCPCCDKGDCAQIQTCHHCSVWNHFTALFSGSFSYSAIDVQKISDPANEQVLELNTPPLTPPPLPPYTS